MDFAGNEKVPTTIVNWSDCFSEKDKLVMMKKSHHSIVFVKEESLQQTHYIINPQNFLFVIDFTCTTTEPLEMLKKIDPRLFGHPFRWIIFLEDEKILSSIKALTDSNIVLVSTMEDEGFNLKQFYKIDEKSNDIYYEVFGSWNKTSGIDDKRVTKIISRRRTNLHLKTITVSYVILNNDSRNHLIDFVDKNEDSISKVNYMAVNAVLDLMNVTKKEIFSNSWGYQDPKTRMFSGMVGDIFMKRAEIGGTPLFMTSERIPVMEFTAMNTPTTGNFIFRAPQLSAVSNIYTLPFESNVWFTVLILVAISTVLLHFTVQIDNNGERRFTDSILSTIAAVCQMDPQLTPKITSSRTILFFIFLALSFLYSAYTANIVSLLQSPAKHIRTLEDLYKSKIKLGAEDTQVNHIYFSTADDPLQRKIYLEKLAPPNQQDNFVNRSIGIAKVRKGLYAFIMEESGAYKIMEDTYYEHQKCELLNIRYIELTHPFIMIQKRSPYKEILKVNIVKLMERGIQKRLLSKIYTKKPVCVNRQNFQSIGIDDCLPALLIIPYGCILALVVLGIENLMAWRKFNDKICLTI
ncbi:unnamed protein product [Diamesa hyperborea]